MDDDDEPLFMPEIPEDIKQEVLNRHNKQQMRSDEVKHTIAAFIRELGEDHLVAFRNVLGAIANSGAPVATAAMYQGMVASRLDREYGICLGCWDKHDDQLEQIIKTEHT